MTKIFRFYMSKLTKYILNLNLISKFFTEDLVAKEGLKPPTQGL